MLNHVSLIGRLGADPELKQLQGGKTVCTVSVATTEKWTDNQGQKQEKTEWHRVSCWDKTAENLAKYSGKGKLVYVDGKIQSREYDDKNGQKQRSFEIQASRVIFLEFRENAQQGQQPQQGYGQQAPQGQPFAPGHGYPGAPPQGQWQQPPQQFAPPPQQPPQQWQQPPQQPQPAPQQYPPGTWQPPQGAQPTGQPGQWQDQKSGATYTHTNYPGNVPPNHPAAQAMQAPPQMQTPGAPGGQYNSDNVPF